MKPNRRRRGDRPRVRARVDDAGGPAGADTPAAAQRSRQSPSSFDGLVGHPASRDTAALHRGGRAGVASRRGTWAVTKGSIAAQFHSPAATKAPPVGPPPLSDLTERALSAIKRPAGQPRMKPGVLSLRLSALRPTTSTSTLPRPWRSIRKTPVPEPPFPVWLRGRGCLHEDGQHLPHPGESDARAAQHERDDPAFGDLLEPTGSYRSAGPARTDGHPIRL